VKADYQISYDEMDDSLEAEWMKLSSSLQVKALGSKQLEKNYRIELDENGISKFIVSSNGNEKPYTCEVQ
jgi:hypothetical protein